MKVWKLTKPIQSEKDPNDLNRLFSSPVGQVKLKDYLL